MRSFQGVRVLVTGAGGFIGSHLVERLVGEKATVRAFVHYNAIGNWGWLDTSPVRGDVEVVAGDIAALGSDVADLPAHHPVIPQRDGLVLYLVGGNEIFRDVSREVRQGLALLAGADEVAGDIGIGACRQRVVEPGEQGARGIAAPILR